MANGKSGLLACPQCYTAKYALTYFLASFIWKINKLTKKRKIFLHFNFINYSTMQDKKFIQLTVKIKKNIYWVSVYVLIFLCCTRSHCSTPSLSPTRDNTKVPHRVKQINDSRSHTGRGLTPNTFIWYPAEIFTIFLCLFFPLHLITGLFLHYLFF